MPATYYIMSKLNGYVLDVSGGSTAPRAAIISYPVNQPPSTNQQWSIEPSATANYFYIISKLNGYVLDVTGANVAPGTPIINYPRNTPQSNNQLWLLALASVP